MNQKNITLKDPIIHKPEVKAPKRRRLRRTFTLDDNTMDRLGEVARLENASCHSRAIDAAADFYIENSQAMHIKLHPSILKKINRHFFGLGKIPSAEIGALIEKFADKLKTK
jgi:hypothetical protein